MKRTRGMVISQLKFRYRFIPENYELLLPKYNNIIDCRYERNNPDNYYLLRDCEDYDYIKKILYNGGLKKQDREFIILHFLYDFKMVDISNIYGTSLHLVSLKIRRGLRRLRDRIHKNRENTIARMCK